MLIIMCFLKLDLLLLTLLLSKFFYMSGEVYNIIPTQTLPYKCRESPCLITTLSQFAINWNSSHSLASNITLLISGEHHSLDVRLSVSNVSKFIMQSIDGTSNPVITCINSGNLNFINIDNVQFKNLKFEKCNGSRFELVQHLNIECSSFIKSPVTIINSNGSVLGTNFHFNFGSYRYNNASHHSIDSPDESSKYSQGGALMVTCSTFIIKNSTFEKNTANFGGAIFVEFNSSVTISNSTFKHNHAERSISEKCAGGAIYSKRSVMIISNTSFLNNTSDFDGGIAVVINATLLVSHCFIYMNTAGRHGGAIAAFRNSSLTLKGTILNNSRAEHSGGAVYLNESSGNISGCNISFSSTKTDGGAIHEVHNSSIKVNNSTFENNSAPDGNGGALCGHNSSTVVISNSMFLNNVAKNGGVVQVKLNSALNIINSIFRNSCATAEGGVAYVHNNSIISIKDSTFKNNLAGGDTGGAVMIVSHSKMNISNCKFDNNEADYGGAIDVSEGSNASVKSCSFNGNRAKSNGAAIHVYVESEIIISDCTFFQNKANIFGAAVSAKHHCNISIVDSFVHNCTAGFSGGGVFVGHVSYVHIKNCEFLNNRADLGGAVSAFILTIATIINSSFVENKAAIEGGTLHAYRNSSISVQSSNFSLNRARSGGVCVATIECEVSFQNSSISNSSADFGGVIGLHRRSIVSITGGTFTHNSAQSGGVVYAHSSKVVVKKSAIFSFNSARLFGGVIHANDDTTIAICTAIFSNNTADFGGVLSLLDSSVGFIQYSDFVNSQATSNGGVVYLNDASLSVHSSRFNSSCASIRGGILSASSASRVYIARSNFSYGTAKVGAALTLIEKSNISFIPYQDFLHLSPSELLRLSVNNSEMPIIGDDEVLICNSTAMWIGGGIYLLESSVHIGIETNITFNKAGSFGGGIYAINSSITVKHMVHFVHNKAVFGGGGLSLRNSKLYDSIKHEGIVTSMNFAFNVADNGGAIHVKLDDNENITAVCSTSGCFFENVSEDFTINFDKNHAKHKGDDLFGGLLDRCTVSNTQSIANQSQMTSIGVARFKSISNITMLNTISSKPVRVCFCENHKPNCHVRSKTVEVKHRDTILLEIVSIDQVNHKIIATIKSRIDDCELPVSQATQTIGAICSNVSYHITAPPREAPYQATVYADGPCSDKGISKLTVNVKVLQCKCAIGLVYLTDNNSGKECKCQCDPQLLNYHYVQKCDPDKNSVEREGVFWITVTDTHENFSYLFFPYCPMGYCQSPDKLILVDLSQANGSDAQCANNHAGLLCGKCRPHYSLSLGSSKCIKCHKKWYGLLIGIIIASIFAGIFLVAFILVLNLTVAVGTLNSVIFYANIVYSGRILTQSRFSSVFIAWLNLDIGFDVCFYEGMDTYTKTWLELAFPAYIIFLVIAIIWISSRSSTFSNLIGKRNPVATLATLILISYTKFFQIIIVTFSFVKSTGSITPPTRWLYDASIVYFGWKHALLFFTAVVILIVGLFYTILLFSWQWLLHYPRSKVLNWTRNQKLHSFIDTYHTPHTAKHRYWTGLLLLARVILYLISAFSASVYADPHIPLLAIITVMCCLLLFKTVMMIKVYRNWLLNAMDSFMFFNIIIPAIFILHFFNNISVQTKMMDMSVGITIILLCFIIAFHVYRYGSVKLYIFSQNTKIYQSMTKWLSFIQPQENSSSSPSDGRLLDVLDSLRQDDHDEAYDQHKDPTSSVVSMVHSEESPLSDYRLKLTEGENQVQSNKANIEQQESEDFGTHAPIRSYTKKSASSCYTSQGDSIRKPLLDEKL